MPRLCTNAFSFPDHRGDVAGKLVELHGSTVELGGINIHAQRSDPHNGGQGLPDQTNQLDPTFA